MGIREGQIGFSSWSHRLPPEKVPWLPCLGFPICRVRMAPYGPAVRSKGDAVCFGATRAVRAHGPGASITQKPRLPAPGPARTQGCWSERTLGHQPLTSGVPPRPWLTPGHWPRLVSGAGIPPSIPPSISPSLHLSIHPSILPSLRISLHPSTSPPSLHPSIHLRPSICPSSHPPLFKNKWTLSEACG